MNHPPQLLCIISTVDALSLLTFCFIALQPALIMRSALRAHTRDFILTAREVFYRPVQYVTPLNNYGAHSNALCAGYSPLTTYFAPLKNPIHLSETAHAQWPLSVPS